MGGLRRAKEPGIVYFGTKSGAEELGNLQNHSSAVDGRSPASPSAVDSGILTSVGSCRLLPRTLGSLMFPSSARPEGAKSHTNIGIPLFLDLETDM